MKPTKERANRISLDYFRRPDRILTWKRGLAVAALAAALGWSAWAHVWTGEEVYSPGRLAVAHAPWQQQCSACHVDFVAIRDDAWFAKGRVDSQQVDQQCQKCHAGPPHHTTETPAPSCASCHRDHQGPQTDLTRVSDRACTQCHEDLQLHAPQRSEFARSVTRFDSAHHPPFRSLEKRQDPGRLKFSHGRHLTAGLTLGPKDRADAVRLDKIPQAHQAAYEKFVNQDGLLQLDCSACHTTDAADAPSATSSSHFGAGDGAYMLPINYEAHCQACHPLRLEPGQAASTDLRNLVPHGLKAEELALFVQRAFAQRAIAGGEISLDTPAAAGHPLPDKPAVAESAAARLTSDTRSSLAHLRSACSECHHYDPASQVSPDDFPAMLATEVPRTWLAHARFDHLPHRAVDCQACHVAAKPIAQPDTGTQASVSLLDDDQVMIPAIDVCLRCHAPAATSGDQPVGGARFDCAECHTYHDGHGSHAMTQPAFQFRAGRGSNKRDALQQLDLEHFLSGEGRP